MFFILAYNNNSKKHAKYFFAFKKIYKNKIILLLVHTTFCPGAIHFSREF